MADNNTIPEIYELANQIRSESTDLIAWSIYESDDYAQVFEFPRHRRIRVWEEADFMGSLEGYSWQEQVWRSNIWGNVTPISTEAGIPPLSVEELRTRLNAFAEEAEPVRFKAPAEIHLVEAYRQGIEDRVSLDEALRRGLHGTIQYNALEDRKEVLSVAHKALLADDLKTISAEAIERVYRLAGRWDERDHGVSEAVAIFDETVSRPDRSQPMPTTLTVRSLAEPARPETPSLADLESMVQRVDIDQSSTAAVSPPRNAETAPANLSEQMSDVADRAPSSFPSQPSAPPTAETRPHQTNTAEPQPRRSKTMATRIPVALEGRLTAEPEAGTSASGTDWARFDIAVNDRRLNDETGQWEDGDVIFHQVATFGAQARHVAASLHKGDNVVVNGDLKFGSYEKDGVTRETRQVIADTVGASLKFNNVEIAQNAPKAKGPEAYATGPVATPDADHATTLTQ